MIENSCTILYISYAGIFILLMVVMKMWRKESDDSFKNHMSWIDSEMKNLLLEMKIQVLEHKLKKYKDDEDGTN